MHTTANCHDEQPAPEEGQLLRQLSAALGKTSFGEELMSRKPWCKSRAVAHFFQALYPCILCRLYRRPLQPRRSMPLFVAAAVKQSSDFHPAKLEVKAPPRSHSERHYKRNSIEHSAAISSLISFRRRSVRRKKSILKRLSMAIRRSSQFIRIHQGWVGCIFCRLSWFNIASFEADSILTKAHSGN